MPAVLSCLVSCRQVSYENCPTYPVAGAAVAVELEKASYSEFPNTWEWIGRVLLFARLHLLYEFVGAT